MEFNEKQMAILKVAEQIISEKGFESTSIRDISKVANINLAMISYYFGSKDKLLEALFASKINALNLEIDKVAKSTTSALDKTLAVAENYINKIFMNINIHKIMLKEMDFLDSTGAFEQIKLLKSQNNAVISQILQQGIENKEINPTVTADMVVTTVFGTILHYVLNEKYYRFHWELKPEDSFADQTKMKIKNQVMYTLKAILTYE